MTTWVVVADSARARFFRVEENSGEHGGSLFAPGEDALPGRLLEMTDLVHPASRQHASEMASDEPGIRRTMHMHGKIGMDEKVSLKEEEAVRFAKEVADVLRERAADYERLYLVAEPHFLGLLRADLDKSVEQRIVAEIDKDLSAMDATEIRGHLPERL